MNINYRRMFGPRNRAPVVKNAIDGQVPELMVYGEIGWEVSSMEFVSALTRLRGESEVHVRINSPGGNVFEGLTIANAMKAFDGKIVVHVDALAASIASIIAIAGDEVRMATNAFVMIHEPFTFTGGTAEDFRKIADTLEKMTSTFVADYARKSGAEDEQIRAWMKAETWFTSAEALENGFVDVVEEPSDAEAGFDLSVFAHAPEQLKRMTAGEGAPTVRKIEKALRDAGLSRAESRKMASSYGRSEQDDPRDADEQEAVLTLASTLAASFRSTTAKE